VNYAEQVEEILVEFDFGKVYRVMHFLNWHWYDSHLPYIPDFHQLSVHAQKLLEEVSEYSSCRIACGGFLAENREGRLSLKFVVANWNAGE
jgi:hypothetical protein